MLSLVQRVTEAKVEVDGVVTGAVGAGLVALVCAVEGDEDRDVAWTVKKVTGLRVFADEAGKMNLSVADIGGGILAVSQFTLAGDVTKGTRPSFGRAMEPVGAAAMFNQVVAGFGQHVPTETGVFAADMKVSLVNDGPVTIWLDSRKRRGQP